MRLAPPSAADEQEQENSTALISLSVQLGQESSNRHETEQSSHTELPGGEYIPFGHGVQLVALALDTVTAGHMMQVCDPSMGVWYPAGQEVQMLAPGPDAVPAGQSVQEAAVALE